MVKYYLAVDIGASSGRHILGWIEDGKLAIEEVYRFPNGMENIDGSLCWNVDRLYHEILEGMKRCKELGKIPESVGVDTWGVDFVLLDKNDKIIGNSVGYRDHRTDGMDKEVYKTISEDKLYARTGILKAIYNTIYQLMSVKAYNPDDLKMAESLLMMPDYFHFMLTGKKVQEYSEATTSQLVNPLSRDWDYELIEMLGFPRKIFQKICFPGTVLANLKTDVKEYVGYDCKVVLPPTHDTQSAMVAIPSVEDMTCFISSGTWSLMGVERDEPDCSIESREANFTNEGGYDGKIAYLSNIMGLWMIQSVRNKLAPDMSYGELCEAASKEGIASIVDCQDESFLSPDDMCAAVREYCRATGQQIPETLSQLACVIYNSLAQCYGKQLVKIEKLTGIRYDKINIIGGGSNADYLNRLTAKYTGLPVYAGPGEATAIGNILTQMIQNGVFPDLKSARECVSHSFEVKIFE